MSPNDKAEIARSPQATDNTIDNDAILDNPTLDNPTIENPTIENLTIENPTIENLTQAIPIRVAAPLGLAYRLLLRRVLEATAAAAAGGSFVLAGLVSLWHPRLRFAAAEAQTQLEGPLEIPRCGVDQRRGRASLRTTADILLACPGGWNATCRRGQAIRLLPERQIQPEAGSPRWRPRVMRRRR